MTSDEFVPVGFDPPTSLATDQFRLEPLGPQHNHADHADATVGELSARTGCAERYVREWLEQQAVAGFLTVDDPDAEPSARRYQLPAAHRPVLVDEDGLNYLTPWAGIAVDVLYPFEQLLDAYRTGTWVPFEAYGPDLVDANRRGQPAPVREPDR